MWADKKRSEPLALVVHFYGWGGRIRTSGTRDQSPLPYHLATPQGQPTKAQKYSRAGKKGQERSHLAQSAAKAFSHRRSSPEIVRPAPPKESRPSCSQGETPFNEYFASIRCWEETRAPCGSAFC